MLNDTHPNVATPDRVTPTPKLDLLTHKPQEVAQQLTLLQFAFYTAIDRREMLNTAWKGKYRCRDAPNVVRAIEQGNKVCVTVYVNVYTVAMVAVGMVAVHAHNMFFVSECAICNLQFNKKTITRIHSC